MFLSRSPRPKRACERRRDAAGPRPRRRRPRRAHGRRTRRARARPSQRPTLATRREATSDVQRSYHVESTGSRPITEVKRRRARSVLGRVTAWEHRVSLTRRTPPRCASFFYFGVPGVRGGPAIFGRQRRAVRGRNFAREPDSPGRVHKILRWNFLTCGMLLVAN